jgi:hypothetical protein
MDQGVKFGEGEFTMTAIAQKLDHKLESWVVQKAAQVERMLAEIIELADEEALDLMPTRQVTQEVLDVVDQG